MVERFGVWGRVKAKVKHANKLRRIYIDEICGTNNRVLFLSFKEVLNGSQQPEKELKSQGCCKIVYDIILLKIKIHHCFADLVL
jgi:hypothetical protein